MMCSWISFEYIDQSAEEALDKLAAHIGKIAPKVHFSIVQLPQGVHAPVSNVKGFIMIDHPSVEIREQLAGLSHYNHEDLFFEPTCAILRSVWNYPIKHYYYHG